MENLLSFFLHECLVHDQYVSVDSPNKWTCVIILLVSDMECKDIDGP